jgi:hypothetical protein
MSGAPALRLLRSIQVDPRTTPGVTSPSPSQSPISWTSPACP